MKKLYTQPEVSVTVIFSENIMTLSGVNTAQSGSQIKSVGKTEIKF